MKVRILPTKAAGDRLSFAGVSAPISFQDTPEVLDNLKAVTVDWPHQAVTGLAAVKPPRITLRRTAHGFTRVSPWLAEPKSYPDPVNAACDLVVDLINAYVADHPSQLCLHTAAVHAADGLVLLVSDYRGGKSTLAVRMMAAGYPLFTDDVVPIDPATGDGIALGVMARLRRPWPTAAGDLDFQNFVKQRRGAQSKRYTYVVPRDGEQVAHGERAPVIGIVLLEREDGASPLIEPLGEADAVKYVTLRNFARQGSALEILEGVKGLVAGARCLRLRYEDARQAFELISREFPTPGC